MKKSSKKVKQPKELVDSQGNEYEILNSKKTPLTEEEKARRERAQELIEKLFSEGKEDENHVFFPKKAGQRKRKLRMTRKCDAPERDPNAFRYQADFDDGIIVRTPSDGIFGCGGEAHSWAIWEFEDESEPFRWRISECSWSQEENELVWGKDFLSPEWFDRWESTLKSQMRHLRDEIRRKMKREIESRKQEDIYQESLLSELAETCSALMRMKEMLEKVEPKNKNAFRSIVRLAIETGFSHALCMIREKSVTVR